MDLNRTVARRTLLKAMAAGTATLLLGGCSPSAPSGSPAATAGAAPPAGATPDRAVRMVAVQGQGLFEAPNPFGSRTGPGQQQMAYIFDSLAWRDSTVDPIPWLAEKWISSADGTEWTFTLREKIAFQDGKPLTADDVVFSYQYLPRYPTTYYGSLSETVKEITAVDPRTVRIVLSAPMAPFLNTVAASTPILPKHIWSSITDPVKFNEPQAFLGSGPYRLTSMNEADSSFQFTANDSFFLGKPYVRRIEFIPTADELVALKAGKLDVSSPVAYVGITDEVLAPFRSDPRFSIIEAPGEGVTALYFNHSKGEPYSNPLFRRAVTYAINRQEVVDRLLGGNGEPGSPGDLPSSNPFAAKEIKPYAYDPARAKALLDEAGFGEKDGQRVLPNGSPLSVPLLFGSNQARIAELLRTQLALVGIKLDLRSVDPGTASQMQGAGTYEASIVTHGGLGGDPDTHMFRVFNGPDTLKHWQKCWGYHNDQFDKLAREQRRTLDGERRTALLHQMQQLLSQDMPIVHLFYPNRYIIYDPRVFDAWYFTPLSNPLAMNKHFFVTGQKTGLSIRQS